MDIRKPGRPLTSCPHPPERRPCSCERVTIDRGIVRNVSTPPSRFGSDEATRSAPATPIAEAARDDMFDAQFEVQSSTASSSLLGGSAVAAAPPANQTSTMTWSNDDRSIPEEPFSPVLNQANAVSQPQNGPYQQGLEFHDLNAIIGHEQLLMTSVPVGDGMGAPFSLVTSMWEPSAVVQDSWGIAYQHTTPAEGLIIPERTAAATSTIQQIHDVGQGIEGAVTAEEHPWDDRIWGHIPLEDNGPSGPEEFSSSRH